MENKKPVICVIGLGYVGLPMAIRSVEQGYEVYGLELDKEKVAIINEGRSPIEEKYIEDRIAKFTPKATTDPAILKSSDIVLICVPTPVDEFYNPDLGPVISATKSVIANLKKGALVVLESTVNPGVSEEIIKPLFEEAGFVVGKDVHIAHCPERVNPGDLKWNVSNLPRVVGCLDEEGLKIALDYYGNITEGGVMAMKSIREAEAVKIMENSFRDINIAFVNELAKSFDKLGIDIVDVIKGASTKFSFMPHFPSCGVGGHCIPVDPYYLIERAKQSGFDHKFLKIARETNNSMPSYTVELLQDLLNDLEMPVKGTSVGVLGISYKSNVDDVRESPYFKIIKELKKHGANVISFDPHVLKLSDVKTLDEILEKSQALVIVTGHKEFKDIDANLLKQKGIKVVIDGANCLNKDEIQKCSILYKGIGR